MQFPVSSDSETEVKGIYEVPLRSFKVQCCELIKIKIKINTARAARLDCAKSSEKNQLSGRKLHSLARRRKKFVLTLIANISNCLVASRGE